MSDILVDEKIVFDNKFFDMHECFHKEKVELFSMIRDINKIITMITHEIYKFFRKINLFLLSKIMLVMNPVINFFKVILLFLLKQAFTFFFRPLKRAYKLAHKIYKVLSLKLVMTLMSAIYYNRKKDKAEKNDMEYFPIPDSFLKKQ